MLLQIAKGDTSTDASQLYPLHVNTLKELIEDPAKLKGKRSEMRYEPYRMAHNKELAAIAYRRLLAAIDWVEFLAEMMCGLSVDDRASPSSPVDSSPIARLLYERGNIRGITGSRVDGDATDRGRAKRERRLQIALVKSCFAPLMVFKWAARTAEVADDPDVLCLCNFAFVPRDINRVYTDT